METYNKSYSLTTVLESVVTGPDINGNIIQTPFRSTITAPVRSQTGFKNPAWLSLKGNFMEAGTAYVMTAQQIKSTKGSTFVNFFAGYPGKADAVYTRVESGNLLRGAIFSSPSSVLDSLVQNQARSSINRKINEFVRPFQGGVFLGELREAIHMVRHPLLSLRKGIDTYLEIASSRARKVRVSNEAKRRRAREAILGNVWLEYVFGWRPFISDIRSFADALAQNNYFARNREVFRSHAKAQQKDDAGFNLNGAFQATYAGAAAHVITRTAILQTKCRIVAGVEVSRNSSRTIDPTLFGFSWNEFAPTVWELIPYSFLADYFTNFGEVISSYSVMPGAVRWGDESLLRQFVYTQSGTYNDALTRANLGVQYRGGGGSVGSLVCTTSSLTRTVGILNFTVTPYFKMPTSWIQGLNIAALADNHRRAKRVLNS